MMISVFFVGDRFPELTTTVADDILETIEKKKYEQSSLKAGRHRRCHYAPKAIND